MKHLKGVRVWWVVIPALAGLIVSGFGGTMSQSAVAGTPETFACVAADKLEKEIAPEAQLETFTCFLKKWKGAEVLHFKVGVKNVSGQPQRFRVNIFLDNDKAIGGLIPRKTKKGLVKPGATASFVYPVKGMSDKANAVTLLIKKMSP